MDADAARFVGRDDERRAVAELFNASTPSRILYFHGAGGIGKSTLLRYAGREALAAGYDVTSFDTRSGTHHLDRFFGANDDIATGFGQPRCVIVDEADHLGSGLPALRDRLLETLSESCRIVFAGRRPPDASWRRDGLDASFVDVALSPLSDGDASALLDALGIAGERTTELISWAQGSPLALTVAGMAPEGRQNVASEQNLEARLIAWLAGVPNLEVATEVLEVAALAPIIDARLLAAALPARPTRDAMAKLASLPVVETIGDRAVLHPVLAAAIATRFAKLQPERHRAVVRRIVEHLGSRARLGDITALIEMSQFITDPALRQAISNHPSGSLFPDVPRGNELGSFARTQGFSDGPDWPEIAAWIADTAPYQLVVRRGDQSIVLFGAFARADMTPSLGPVTKSLRAAVVGAESDPTRTFVGVVLFADVPADLAAEAARLGSGALMHLHRVPDMQAVFIHFPEPDRRPMHALAALAQPFDANSDRAVSLSDYRPDGAVGFVEAIVLGELGFQPRTVGLSALLAQDDDPVRQEQLRARLDEVFDATPADQRLRTVIELTHLTPRHKESACLDALHVSRRTWFRILRQARERVLDPNR